MKKVDLFINGALIADKIETKNGGDIRSLCSDLNFINDYDLANSSIIEGDVIVKSFICSNNVLVLKNITVVQNAEKELYNRTVLNNIK